jgi:hypothetical protein
MSSPVAEPRPRVLVGAAGTTTAFGIVRTLRGRWGAGIEILAADVNPRPLVAAAWMGLAIKTDGKVYLRSRNDNDFTQRYANVVSALGPLPDETVIDGEVVALD